MSNITSQNEQKVVHQNSTSQTGMWESLFKFSSIIVAVMMLSAYLPMGYIHLWQVMKKAHYQYVIYIPVLLVLLYFRNEDNIKRRIQPGNIIAVILLLFVATMFTFVSILKWSPWLNYATFLFSVMTYMYWLRGVSGVVNAYPYILVSVCALPLPFELDGYVTTWLRNSATDWSSRILDIFGISNLTYKNVIELNGKELFVADACSGIHSLFVMITASIFICMWNSRGFFHTLFLLLATIGIVMVENVSRLVIVSYAWTIGHNLTEGNPHKILGFILFACSLFFVWSFENLLTFFFGSRQGKTRNYTSSILEGSQTIPQAARNLTPWTGMIFCSLIFPIFGLMQIGEANQQIASLPPIVLPEYPLPRYERNLMPETFHNLKLTRHVQVKRVPEDPMGKNSQAWEYRLDGLFVRISIDYPYDAPHDMCLCYFNTGWNLIERSSVNVDNKLSFSDATMDRPNFGHGYVAFVQFNNKGQYQFEQKADERVGINTPESAKNRTFNMFSNLLGRDRSKNFTANSNRYGPWYQVHLIAISHSPVTPELRDELRLIFKDAQQILVNESLKNLSGSNKQ